MQRSIASFLNVIVMCASCIVYDSVSASAQQPLDRVIARVGSHVIMQSDVTASVALGVVEGQDAEPAGSAAIEQVIERHVLLAEVARFPPPEPTVMAIDELAGAMKARVGPRLQVLMQETGIDEAGIRELARDTLRIRAYVRQRFGAPATLDNPEVRQWLRDARGRATVVIPAGR
jgi:hypothetical protein